jgi:hypothetical protein
MVPDRGADLPGVEMLAHDGTLALLAQLIAIARKDAAAGDAGAAEFLAALPVDLPRGWVIRGDGDTGGYGGR